MKTRTVQCMAVGKTTSIVDSSLCSQIKRAPSSSKSCNKKPCPYSWTHSDWTNVSVIVMYYYLAEGFGQILFLLSMPYSAVWSVGWVT